MYPYLESIRIENGKPQNLDFHQERLNRTYAHAYGSLAPFRLQELIKYPEGLSDEKLKLRFLYEKRLFRYELEKYKPKAINSLHVVFDDEIEYSHKRSDRRSINKLIAQKKGCDDILIIKNGFVTDSSAANICFFNGKEWLTPDTPLLQGTCRARLLKQGKIHEASIRLEDISTFRSFCLISAMIEGFDKPLPVSSIIQHA